MYAAIVFLPLLGSAIAGLFGRLIGARPSELVTTVLLFASMVLSWIAFVQVGFGHQDARVMLVPWIVSGDLDRRAPVRAGDDGVAVRLDGALLDRLRAGRLRAPGRPRHARSVDRLGRPRSARARPSW